MSSRIYDPPSDTATLASATSQRAPPPPISKIPGALSTPEVCALGADLLSQGTIDNALRAAQSATGACSSSVASPNQGTGARALTVAPLATGARLSSTASLSYGNFQTMGGWTSSAVLLSLCSRACPSTTALLCHAPKSIKTVAPERRNFEQGCPPPSPPD